MPDWMNHLNNYFCLLAAADLSGYPSKHDVKAIFASQYLLEPQPSCEKQRLINEGLSLVFSESHHVKRDFLYLCIHVDFHIKKDADV